MPYLTRDDVRLFYTDDGSGPVALLLHGWGCDSHDWSWQIPVLTRTYRVVALDQRGHGRSSAPEGSYQAQVLADDAALSVRHPSSCKRSCSSIPSTVRRTNA